MILMGKDGEEKIRWQKVNLTEIFAVIDGMPMRQREMRERNKKQQWGETICCQSFGFPVLF